MSNEITPITTHDVESRIIMVRGQQVILDCDVAELYGVETKRINEAVRNNPEKFPPRCLLKLTDEESAVLRSKISSLENCGGKGKYSKYEYYAFTDGQHKPPSQSLIHLWKYERWRGR